MIDDFWQMQMRQWPMAAAGNVALGLMRTRRLAFDGFEVRLQFNPARIRSTAADVRAQAIASRPCFLCAAHRPAEQLALALDGSGRFEILVNPYPIFDRHLTIAATAHTPQLLAPYLPDMLAAARALGSHTVFFNGAGCGASAPDHAHFQAVPRGLLPLPSEYAALAAAGLVDTIDAHADAVLTSTARLGRLACRIEGRSADSIGLLLRRLFAMLGSPGAEPPINALCECDDGLCRLIVVPRRAMRPRRYGDGPGRLMVSPASVEVGGVFVVPIESHFERITPADVLEIFADCCYTSWP